MATNIFQSKKSANDYISSHLSKGLNLFTKEDSSEFIVLSYDELHDLMDNQGCNICENYESTEKLKLFMKIDVSDLIVLKNNNTDVLQREYMYGNAKYIVNNISKFMNIDPNKMRAIIIGCYSPNRISAYIVFPDIVFDNIILCIRE